MSSNGDQADNYYLDSAKDQADNHYYHKGSNFIGIIRDQAGDKADNQNSYINYR